MAIAKCIFVIYSLAVAAALLLGLVAIGLAFMGDRDVWELLQTLGTSHRFTVAGVAMSAFAIAGMFGSFTMSAVPRHVPNWIIASAALLALWCGLYALYAPRSLAWFVVSCAVGGFYWNFI